MLSTMLCPLAQMSPEAGLQIGSDPRSNWLPVVLMLILAVGFAGMNVLMSVIVGPGRTGKGKSTPYESGMVPVGTARRRFNVRFYVVAMVFLVFDVTIVFFYPFAGIFAPYVRYDAAAGTHHAGVILIAMGSFLAILLTAYAYAWGKGVFKFD